MHFDGAQSASTEETHVVDDCREVDRSARATPFLAAVSKRDVYMALDRIKSRVEAMEDFTQFS